MCAKLVAIGSLSGVAFIVFKKVLLVHVLYPSQAIPGVGAHLHTPGHHGDTQGWGAPDLSDNVNQGWAPALTYHWAPPFVLNT